MDKTKNPSATCVGGHNTVEPRPTAGANFSNLVSIGSSSARLAQVAIASASIASNNMAMLQLSALARLYDRMALLMQEQNQQSNPANQGVTNAQSAAEQRRIRDFQHEVLDEEHAMSSAQKGLEGLTTAEMSMATASQKNLDNSLDLGQATALNRQDLANLSEHEQKAMLSGVSGG